MMARPDLQHDPGAIIELPIATSFDNFQDRRIDSFLPRQRVVAR